MITREDGKLIISEPSGPGSPLPESSVPLTIDPSAFPVMPWTHDRDLAEFVRLTKLGYRYVEQDLLGVKAQFYIDPFHEGPTRFVL